jgi:hypothetical protein
MASSPPGKPHDEGAIIERALRRLYGRRQMDKQSEANAADLVSYLLKTGVRDEDELVELARIANGKRYDPGNGSFL